VIRYLSSKFSSEVEKYEPVDAARLQVDIEVVGEQVDFPALLADVGISLFNGLERIVI
jgi:hypothetical protein